MEKQSSQPIPRLVKVFAAVSFLNDIASEMIYPVVPIFLTTVLAVPIGIVGLIEGIAEATSSFMRLVSGWWSDKIKRRKPFVVFGYGLTSIAKPLLALAYSWPTVLFARFIDRFGKGLRTSARDAWIADITPPEIRGKSFGFHRAFDTAGAIVGPLLTAVILYFLPGQFRTLFLIAFVPGVLAILLLAAVAKEPRASAPIPKDGLHFKDWHKIQKSFWIFVIFSALFGLANSSQAFIILRAKSLGWSTVSVILAYVFYNITYAAVSYPAGKLSDRVGRKSILVMGLLVFAASYLGFGLYSSPMLLFGLFGLFGISVSLTDGTSRAIVADISGKEVYGASYGVYGMAMSLSNLAASIWFGIVSQGQGFPLAFLISSVLAVIAAIGIILFVKKPEAA